MAELSSNPDWITLAQQLAEALKQANSLKNNSAIGSPHYVAAQGDIKRILIAMQALGAEGARQVDAQIASSGVLASLHAQTVAAASATKAIKKATDQVAAIASAVDMLTKLVAQFGAIIAH
jgi:hypothetical protein